MTTTKLWDAEFLNERERDAREEAVWLLAEADWKRALAEADRIRSNGGCRYRLCRNAACRRARSCVGDTPNCVKPASDVAAPSPLADHLYAKMQVARREAAKAEIRKAGKKPAGVARASRRRGAQNFRQCEPAHTATAQSGVVLLQGRDRPGVEKRHRRRSRK